MSIYKNDKNLLTEVNRMKQIMGVQFINEGWDDIIKSILGVSKDSGEKITQEIGDDVKKLSSSLSKIGGDSLSDVTSYLSKQGLDTDDDIIKWIKTQPEIMDQIAKSSDQIMKQASNIVYEKLKLEQILTPNAIRSIDSVLSRDVSRLTVGEIDMVLSTLVDIYKNTPNSNVYDLIKQLEDQRLLVLTYKDNITKSSTPTGAIDDVTFDFDSYVNRIFDEESEDVILNQDETFDDFIGKLIPEKLPKKIDRDKLIAEIRERTAKISPSNVEESERIFRDVYTTSQKDVFIAKSMKSLKDAQDQISSAIGEDNSYFKWFKRGNDGLNKVSKEDVSWIKKFGKFVWKNYTTAATLCAVYEAYKLTQTYDKQSLSDTGTQVGLGVVYCGIFGIAWPALLPAYGVSSIADKANIGQYSNDGEGWKEWIEDNTKELGIVDYGFDTTENKRYINLSNDDQKFVNYDTESETFITEN